MLKMCAILKIFRTWLGGWVDGETSMGKLQEWKKT
jgi:hypothetical protein